MILYWFSHGLEINFGYYTVYSILTVAFGWNMFFLARRWPLLCQNWTQQEMIFRHPPYSNLLSGRDYKRTFNCFTFWILAILVIQYILFQLWEYEESRASLALCGNHTNLTTLQYTYESERPHLFTYITFQTWMAPLLTLQWMQAELLCGLSGNFVILLCVWLALRMEQINNRVQALKKTGKRNDWIKIYEHYRKLGDIVKEVDYEAGCLVITGMLMMLVNLCYSIFKVLRMDEGMSGLVYFLFQSCYNLVITFIYFFKADKVMAIAGEIQEALLGVLELEDLHCQIMTSKAVFTGKGLFSLDKPTLLAVS